MRRLAALFCIFLLLPTSASSMEMSGDVSSVMPIEVSDDGEVGVGIMHDGEGNATEFVVTAYEEPIMKKRHYPQVPDMEDEKTVSPLGLGLAVAAVVAIGAVMATIWASVYVTRRKNRNKFKEQQVKNELGQRKTKEAEKIAKERPGEEVQINKEIDDQVAGTKAAEVQALSSDENMSPLKNPSDLERLKTQEETSLQLSDPRQFSGKEDLPQDDPHSSSDDLAERDSY